MGLEPGEGDFSTKHLASAQVQFQSFFLLMGPLGETGAISS